MFDVASNDDDDDNDDDNAEQTQNAEAASENTAAAPAEKVYSSVSIRSRRLQQQHRSDLYPAPEQIKSFQIDFNASRSERASLFTRTHTTQIIAVAATAVAIKHGPLPPHRRGPNCSHN